MRRGRCAAAHVSGRCPGAATTASSQSSAHPAPRRPRRCPGCRCQTAAARRRASSRSPPRCCRRTSRGAPGAAAGGAAARGKTSPRPPAAALREARQAGRRSWRQRAGRATGHTPRVRAPGAGRSRAAHAPFAPTTTATKRVSFMLEPPLSMSTLLASVPLPGGGGSGGHGRRVRWAGQQATQSSCRQPVLQQLPVALISPSHLGQISFLGSGRRKTGLTSTSTPALMGGQPPAPSLPPEHTKSHTSLQQGRGGGMHRSSGWCGRRPCDKRPANAPRCRRLTSARGRPIERWPRRSAPSSRRCCTRRGGR